MIRGRWMSRKVRKATAKNSSGRWSVFFLLLLIVFIDWYGQSVCSEEASALRHSNLYSVPRKSTLLNRSKSSDRRSKAVINKWREWLAAVPLADTAFKRPTIYPHQECTYIKLHSDDLLFTFVPNHFFRDIFLVGGERRLFGRSKC